MTTTHADVVAWLGPVAEELDSERLAVVVARIRDAWDAIAAAMPPEADAYGVTYEDPDRAEVSTGAGMYILGDLPIKEARTAYEAAQAQAMDARMRLRGAVTAAVVTGDVSASRAAALAGVATTTVTREWGAR